MSEEDEISSKRAKGPLDVSRRALLIGAGSTAALLGLGALRYAGHNPLVRPPGGQDEARLVSACIRCEKCYEACPRGVIVPAHIEDGLLGMRSPALKFDADFCDYCADENGGEPLCVKLPADATAENTLLGLAVIDEAQCLAFRDTGCRYCYDACPYEAIELTGEGANPHVSVLADKCNGCGACESVCVSLKAGSIVSGAQERAIVVVLSVGLIAGVSMGTLSGFGWETFSALCPLGALATMIATKTVVPRAVVSIVIMAVLVLAVGRAFCGWVCPVPLLDRVRGFFRSPKKRTALEQAKRSEMLASSERAKRVEGSPTAADGAYSHDCGSCSSCKGVRAKLDSRHYVLGGALLSTAVFGFPVFCLVCPIGLTFATVLVVWRLFAAGDMTWSVVLIPLLLVVELVFLRKWCTRFCPMAGLMNLVSRFSKTWRPVIDESKCLETVNGAACSKCAIACEADINLRHPDFGERTLADCTRCRACVDACPAKAVSMPFLVKKGAGPQASTVVLADIDEKTAE